MSTLLVKGNKIQYNNKFYELDDMFSNELFEECNRIADEYNDDICIVNEVFLNRVQPYKAIEFFLSGINIDIIKFEKMDEKLAPLLLDYAKKRDIKVEGIPFFYELTKKMYGYFNIMLTALYLIWKMLLIPQTSNLHSNNECISLIRTVASKKKLSFLNNVDFRYEDYQDNNSIYNCFKRIEKVLWVIKSWIMSYKEITIYVNYINRVIGPHSSCDAFKYYCKRIVHTQLYNIIVDKFFTSNQGKKFYTGNNLDRYALIEEKIAKKHDVEVICIPHGLEYGFKLPHCFIGNKFYATSLNASIHLNGLYGTNKFVYDHEVACKMFSVKSKKKYGGDIVFFTEPREVEVNFKIIEELVPLLNEKGHELFIKLHPKDIKSDYDKYSKDVRFIDDFSESVTDNICLSRKSTTLLEALYNNSDVAAILINSKDKVIFNTFVSLQDKKIKEFHSISELFEWILEKKFTKKVGGAFNEDYRSNTSSL